MRFEFCLALAFGIEALNFSPRLGHILELTLKLSPSPIEGAGHSLASRWRLTIKFSPSVDDAGHLARLEITIQCFPTLRADPHKWQLRLPEPKLGAHRIVHTVGRRAWGVYQVPNHK